MKIVLRSDVENLGTKGDLVEVRDGYARNFLVPRGLAIVATPGAERQAAAMRRNREAREVRERAAAAELAEVLGSRRIEVGARAGEGGRLFGSVTTADIAEAVAAQFDVELDRRKVGLDEPIKELGEHEMPVRLHTDVEAVLRITVVAR
ncbi:MAG: 50S ribosomal protein L9 [Acidimicrobiia bacterium]|nr:50S ribosomal protein L9 [Acidimicrobiia bacterium]